MVNDVTPFIKRVYLYIFLYSVFVIVYMSDQIALNYVACIYFASPGASHLLNQHSLGHGWAIFCGLGVEIG